MSVSPRIRSALGRQAVLTRWGRHDEAAEVRRDVAVMRLHALLDDVAVLPLPLTPEQRAHLVDRLTAAETGNGGGA